MKFLVVFCVFLLVGSACCSSRRRRQAVAPAAPADAGPDTAGMNVALGFLVDELDKETALGGPVDPQGLQKASNLAMKIQLLGGEVDSDTGAKLDDIVSEAAEQPGFGQYLTKPADTKVNAPAQGP